MIQFYKGTKNITGSAGQFWYSTGERAVFAELLKQLGWDANKGPNGVGTFKDPTTGKSNPKTRNFVKLKLEEVCEILNVIRDNREERRLNRRASLKNEVSEKFNARIAEINIGLKEKGETPIIPIVPEPLVPLGKFNAYHRSQKQSTQIFFEAFVEKRTGKHEGRYLFSILKTSLEDTTNTGKVSISLLLTDVEVRYLEEYLITAVKDVSVYNPKADDPILKKLEEIGKQFEEGFVTLEELIEKSTLDPGERAWLEAQQFADATGPNGEELDPEAINAAKEEASSVEAAYKEKVEEAKEKVNNTAPKGSQSIDTSPKVEDPNAGIADDIPF